VILSGVLVLWLHSPVPDLVIGAAIAVYVLKESVGILREAREAREARVAATALVKPWHLSSGGSVPSCTAETFGCSKPPT
jgi:Co/Zn/Cd efflux system component